MSYRKKSFNPRKNNTNSSSTSISTLGIFNQSKRSDIIIVNRPPLSIAFNEHEFFNRSNLENNHLNRQSNLNNNKENNNQLQTGEISNKNSNNLKNKRESSILNIHEPQESNKNIYYNSQNLNNENICNEFNNEKKTRSKDSQKYNGEAKIRAKKNSINQINTSSNEEESKFQSIYVRFNPLLVTECHTIEDHQFNSIIAVYNIFSK